MSNNDDLAFTFSGDGNNVAEVSDTALNLDLVVEELFESTDVEDLVGGWLGGVDDELHQLNLISISTSDQKGER